MLINTTDYKGIRTIETVNLVSKNNQQSTVETDCNWINTGCCRNFDSVEIYILNLVVIE